MANKQIFFKTPYNHDTNEESDKYALTCRDASMTQQSQAEEADINTIVRRFGITGHLPNIPLPPLLADFDEVFDFQTAMNTANLAKQSFMQLPADVRDAFRNDPHRFVSTIDNMLNVQDPAQREENLTVLRAMGLAVTPGPAVDKTTLADVIAAIKERNYREDDHPPKGPPGGQK